MTWLLIGGLFALLALNVPVGFAMLLSSIAYLAVSDIPLVAAAQRLVAGTDAYLLLAIPFFFLAAEIMNSAGIMMQIVRVSQALVGHLRGGLGHVCVLANVLLAGISGSAAADTAGLGRIQHDLLTKGGYGRAFSAALNATAGTLGPVLPPSIPLVVYGGITGVSVGALFMAGIVPGLLMALFMMGVVWYVARKRAYPLQPRQGGRYLFQQALRAIPILVLPLVILGGIRFGAFTPTEAAVVAAAYALLLGGFLMRTFRWKEFFPILTRVGADTANLVFILAASSLYAWLLAREGMPQKLTELFLSISSETWVLLLLINVLVLLLGTVLEPVVCIVLLVPIFDPLIKAVGIDPIHFGIILTLNLMIGLLTPPMGSVIFIMMGIAKVSMAQFMRECWLFVIALTALLFIITYVPWLTLVLPRLLMPASV